MRQQPHRIVGFALAMVLALLGAVLGSSARPAVAAPSETGVSARVEHQRIVDFWTPERMARAVPRDYVRDPATGRFELAPDRDTPTAGAGPNSSIVRGATWTGGGLVRQTTGKAFFFINGGEGSCSASVVEDSTVQTSLVLTAAHCVYDNEARAFADFWLFIPDFDGPLASCADAAYGCWTARGLTVPQDYADQGIFNDAAAMNDVAFVTVGVGDPHGDQLDATVGVQQIAFNRQARGSDTYLFGYPGSQKYKRSSALVYSRGPLELDPRRNDQTYRVGSDMTAGSSGGPWYVGPEGGSGTTMSVSSYRYSGQPSMYGPIFDRTTQELHQAADGFTGGTQIVP